MRRTLTCLVVFPASLSTASAFADPSTPPAREFGSRGTLVIADLAGVDSRPAPTPGTPLSGSYLPFATAFGASTSSYDDTYLTDTGTMATGRASSVAFWIAPSLDYFVTDRLSLGATVAVENVHEHSARGDASDVFSVSAIPRVGYALPIARDITFWPRIAAGYGTSLLGTTRAVSAISARADAGFVFRLSDHVILDAGPYVQWVSSSIGDTAMSTNTNAALGARAMFGLVF